MALPKLDTPIHQIKLESVNEPINYRSFLVKEEKILLTAMETNDNKAIVDAVIQILHNCTISPQIDVRKLPSFDMEYYFLNLRSRSVGETINLKVSHPNAKEIECDHQTEVTVNLDDIKLTKTPDHTNKIMLTDDVGITLNYPSMDNTVSANDNSIESMFEVLKQGVDTIFDKEEIHQKNEINSSELEEFILSLNQQQFTKVMNFYQTMPKLQHIINFTCSKCGKSDGVTLEGLQSFFT